MKRVQKGFGGLQLLLVVAIIGTASLVAVPKYKAHTAKAKLTEAFNLASESKRKITQAYMVSNSLPKNRTEADAMLSNTVSRPEIVRDMKIEHAPSGDTVTIKVFINDGVIENPTGVEQFVFISGTTNHGGKYALEWTCGGEGLEREMLPEDCRG